MSERNDLKIEKSHVPPLAHTKARRYQKYLISRSFLSQEAVASLRLRGRLGTRSRSQRTSDYSQSSAVSHTKETFRGNGMWLVTLSWALNSAMSLIKDI